MEHLILFVYILFCFYFLQKTVSKLDEREHNLYNQARQFESERRKQEQNVLQLREELNMTQKQNKALLKVNFNYHRLLTLQRVVHIVTFKVHSTHLKCFTSSSTLVRSTILVHTNMTSKRKMVKY